MNEELVSIIIPVYNSEKYLASCLKSIIFQTYTQLEIIVVNDGSTDDSESIIYSFANKDSRIKIISKINGGISSARNAGLFIATGKYICFIDSDDCVSFDYIEKLHREIVFTKSDMSMCGYKRENKELFLNSTICEYKDFGTAFYRDVLYSQVVWSKLYRKEILSGLFFDESKKIGEDDLFITEVLARCKSVTSIGEAMYYYTINYQGATFRKFDERKIDILPVFYKKIQIISQHWPESVSYVLKNAVDYYNKIHIEYGIRKMCNKEQFKNKLLQERECLYSCFMVYKDYICEEDMCKIKYYYQYPGKVLVKDRVLYVLDRTNVALRRFVKKIIIRGLKHNNEKLK